MVECQVGLMAACLPCMGPLLGKISLQAQKLRHSYGNGNSNMSVHDSRLHICTRQGNNKKFKRMNSADQSLSEITMRPDRTDKDLTFAEAIAMHEIVVTGKA